ncbi:unnamed protein product [Hydatigera taeniaeformis]|uniref:Secreted protein n=1 Tax=Hydatigena taeniaeformis TaxID=6205 RepID=A0A0R3X218_HYDTA|nr:unnamed protein product [Hydatigera taeniaeformis]
MMNHFWRLGVHLPTIVISQSAASDRIISRGRHVVSGIETRPLINGSLTLIRHLDINRRLNARKKAEMEDPSH